MAAAAASAHKDREFLAVIGDEVRLCLAGEEGASGAETPTDGDDEQDSVTGLLLAGVGVCGTIQTAKGGGYANDPSKHVTPAPDSQKNFLVVDAKTENAAIEAAFDLFTTERKDIGILLINQHVRWHFSLNWAFGDDG